MTATPALTDAEIDSLIRRRHRFEALVKAEPRKPTKRRLAELWRAATQEVHT